MPLIADRNFTLSVNLTHSAKDEGVLYALGDVSGGMVMYVEEAQLHLFYNGFGEYIHLPPVPMPVGSHAVALEYEALGKRSGRGRWLIDGVAAGGWNGLSPTLMGGFHEGFDIGIDRRAPVEWELFERRGNFPYSGVIADVIVESRAFAPDSAFARG